MKVGFIGAGNMAGAILRGMTAGGFSGNDLLVYDTDAAKLAALFEKCGVRICDSGTEVAEGAEAADSPFSDLSLDALEGGYPLDVVSLDLKRALSLLSEITAQNATETLIDQIFSTFCVGK